MGERTVPAILTMLLVVVVFGLMWWGWRSKLKRQSDVAPLPEVPDDLGAPTMSISGQYVVTTSAGDWLDRIAVHGLGIRTRATLNVYPGGILIARTGSADIYIAADELREITTQSGMAGKFVEKEGLVVITWVLGALDVDTGFRTTEAEAKKPLVDTLRELLGSDADQADNTQTPDADISRKNNENE